MKIYPANLQAAFCETPEYGDLPVAFAEPVVQQKSIRLEYNPALPLTASKTEVRAKETFSQQHPLLFDEAGKPVGDLFLTKTAAGWEYLPPAAQEFLPQQVGVSVQIRKNMPWDCSRPVNIRAGFIGDMELESGLIAVFGNAGQRGLAPANVTINGGDAEISSLYNHSISQCDVVFVASPDGVHYADGSDIDFDSYFASNTNLWLAVEEFGGLESGTGSAATLREAYAFLPQEHRLACPCLRFDINKQHPGFPLSGWDYRNWLTEALPALIVLEKERGGYVVVCGRDFLIRAAEHSAAFYEMLLKVHATCWRRSTEKQTWITEYPVDFVHNRTGRVQLFHEPINLHALFSGETALRQNEYQLTGVRFSADTVALVGVDSAGNIALRKKTVGADPQKPAGAISAMLENGSVIQYGRTVMYKLETGISASLFEQDGSWRILVPKTCSSKNGIYLAEDSELALLGEDMRLCYKDGAAGFVAEKDYRSELHGIWLMKIGIEQAKKILLHDVRMLGGGDAEAGEDYTRIGYARMDGRPIRRGGAFVVRLPKRAENKKNAVLQALSQVAAAGEYPVIVFE